MIPICERCYHPITRDEPHVQLARLFRADPDGIHWSQAYLHTHPNQCSPTTTETPPRTASPSSVRHLAPDE